MNAAGVKPSRNRVLAASENGPRATSRNVYTPSSAVQRDDVPVGIGERERPAERAVERAVTMVTP